MTPAAVPSGGQQLAVRWPAAAGELSSMLTESMPTGVPPAPTRAYKK